MSNLKLLSKIFFFLLFFPFITQSTEPVDIWKKEEEIKVDTNKKIENKNQIKININRSVEEVIDYEKNFRCVRPSVFEKFRLSGH